MRSDGFASRRTSSYSVSLSQRLAGEVAHDHSFARPWIGRAFFRGVNEKTIVSCSAMVSRPSILMSNTRRASSTARSVSRCSSLRFGEVATAQMIATLLFCYRLVSWRLRRSDTRLEEPATARVRLATSACRTASNNPEIRLSHLRSIATRFTATR